MMFIGVSFLLIIVLWIYDSLIESKIFNDELVIELNESLNSNKELYKYFSDFSLNKQDDPSTTNEDYEMYSY
jgi:hypothetical protein